MKGKRESGEEKTKKNNCGQKNRNKSIFSAIRTEYCGKICQENFSHRLLRGNMSNKSLGFSQESVSERKIDIFQFFLPHFTQIK